MGAMARSIKLLVPLLLAAAMCTANGTPPDPIVYATAKGAKYHRKNCRLKQGSKGMLLSVAKKKGYKPCAVCKPPK